MAALDSAASSAAAALGAEPLEKVRFGFDLPDDAGASWRVRQVEISEGISELYRAVVELANDDLGADSDALEGASCVVRIERGSAGRRLCGIVHRVEYLGTHVDRLLVRVHVGPALAALVHTQDSRIFQGRSASDVLDEVLTAALAPYRRTVALHLDRQCIVREYLTQARESDLAFALRLMAEEGIAFTFDHAGDREELVLFDANGKLAALATADGGPLQVAGPERDRDLGGVETIRRLEWRREIGTNAVVLRDFDWTRPGLDLTHRLPQGAAPDPERARYDFPAPEVITAYDRDRKAYTDEDGAARALLRREEHLARAVAAAGSSNVTGLAAGLVIEVAGQDRVQLDGKYVVTRVEAAGEAPEELAHELDDVRGRRERFRNTFTCIPFEVPFRPPPHPRPVIPGPQTAIVVGPAGEEIHTDEHGRVKVQFHWDRHGQRDDASSCWLRVAQLWAGAGWGFVFLPRIGMEVVVQFLEGNPDRPLVTGCVYDGDHPPPYELPTKKTVSTIKTRSSPSAEGSNELRFEDAAGSEEIYVHAQKDLDIVVEHDRGTKVVNDQRCHVQANDALTVDGSRTKTVGGDETTTVHGARTTTIKRNETQTMQASREVTVHADDKLTVETGTRTVEVRGVETGTYHGGRRVTVEKGESTTVHGPCDVVADQRFQVQQKADLLLVQNGVLVQSAGDIRLTNAGSGIAAGAGGALKITANEEVSFVCGAASITLKKDGTIEIAGQKVKVGNAANNASFEPAGTAIAGVKVSSTATGIHEIQGALIKIG